MKTHKKKKQQQKRVIDSYEADMRERHERWMAYVKSGKLTKEEAHTCEELEVFVCAVIVFGGISPEDTVMSERAWSFQDVFLLSACQPEDPAEPSYYFGAEEHTVFVLAGLRNGEPDLLTEGMFSSVLFTEERVFFFDSMVAPEFLKEANPEVTSSGYYAMAAQAPLHTVESVEFRPASPEFPHGSVTVRYRSSDAFLARVTKLVDVWDKRAPEIAARVRNEFPSIRETEMGLPDARAKEDYRALMPVLQYLAERGDFRIEDHLITGDNNATCFCGV